MRRTSILLSAVLAACSAETPSNPSTSTTTTSQSGSSAPETSSEFEHPQFDFARWARRFPLSKTEEARKKYPRRFESTKPDDPLDLWKASGEIISSPDELITTELVRARVAKDTPLGRKVPSHLFVWSVGSPAKPHLTKMGGVPHREKSEPWPKNNDRPLTFVAQISFVDSKDIVSEKLPGDVMLIFFEDSRSFYGQRNEAVAIEWSRRHLQAPMTAADCPKPGFPVPELAGVMHRTHEYPDSGDMFEKAGHHQSYLFPTTQSTKTGRETWFIQNDPRRRGKELFCTLNSIQPSAKWPFTNLEKLPKDRGKDDDHYGWSNYEMMMGDVGCMYFLIDRRGRVTWSFDCY